ncbi:MAG: hypothetical protein P9X24_00475 [Candidatus Hatepunaea meridiana]|nr:hypothetical protein [Candidatus Hatepunaea meridiana]
MAHSYTPGLRVVRLTRIVKERRLPMTGEVTVKEGDRVSAQQVVACTDLPGNVHPLNCAGQLGILPADVEAALIVKIGDKITKGETIALSKSFFGLFKSTCASPIDGVLENASPITGQLILRKPPIPVEVMAYIDGRVTKVFENEGVEIETSGAEIQGIFGIGGERFGTIKMLVSSPDKVLDEDDIEGDLTGRIVIGGGRITIGGFKKAMKAGAIAVVAGGLKNVHLKELLGYELGVAITGHEDISTTLVLTEGFGDISMAHRTFDLLGENDGRGASVSGATQIRAGVIRPEVIIPSEIEAPIMDAEKEVGGLEIGQQLRVIRQPNFGNIGSLVNLPAELQELETGAKVRVLELKLDNGENIILPRANVEIIEE